MKTNTAARRPVTHAGAPAHRISAADELRRLTMACMLWEKQFYVDGADVADRVAELIPKVPFETVAQIAIEAREAMKIRHMPLFIACEALKHFNGRKVGDLIARVVQRPDEAAELLALYWRAGKCPLAKQLKVGLARAVQKFDEYQLSKWSGGNGAISLRDVIFLAHPNPRTNEHADRLARLVNRDHVPAEVAAKHGLDPTVVGLSSPETWENRLSRGEDKAAVFAEMIAERKLGALAMLRNLRGMIDAGVPDDVIRDGLAQMKTDRVLPYRFIAAARYAPRFEPQLETSMFRCLEGAARLPGRTALLVDVSGSMASAISAKGDLTRMDAACGLAMLARELCEDVRVFSFSNACIEIPPRRGFGLRDAIIGSQHHGGTELGLSVRALNEQVQHDRLIVITDEQSSDRVPDPKARGWIINVAAYQNGVGYGKWNRVDGWSEAVLGYIQSVELLKPAA